MYRIYYIFLASLAPTIHGHFHRPLCTYDARRQKQVKKHVVELYHATIRAVTTELLKEIRAALLPIVYTNTDLWTSKVSGDKYIGEISARPLFDYTNIGISFCPVCVRLTTKISGNRYARFLTRKCVYHDTKLCRNRTLAFHVHLVGPRIAHIN